jgi:hypothetical protein
MRLCTAGILFAAVVGCGGEGNPTESGRGQEQSQSLRGLPAEVVLRYGEERRVDGTVLRVSFGSVLEDSRCPVDVTCVWAGNAKVEIGIAMGTGPTHPLQLNSTVEPRSAVWNGVGVTLLEVKPEARSTRSIPTGEYLVRLRVEAAR